VVGRGNRTIFLTMLLGLGRLGSPFLALGGTLAVLVGCAGLIVLCIGLFKT